MTVWKAMLVTLACCAGARASAQNNHTTWTDIDCGQLRIPAAVGLKCQGLNYAGVNSYVTGPNGTYRQSNASGTINKVKLLYILMETTSLQSAVSTRSTLAETLKLLTPQATNFSELTTRDGVDFVTFTGIAGAACIGIRRFGTAAIAGYKWIVYATRCVPAKTPVPDADTAAFIASTKPTS